MFYKNNNYFFYGSTTNMRIGNKNGNDKYFKHYMCKSVKLNLSIKPFVRALKKLLPSVYVTVYYTCKFENRFYRKFSTKHSPIKNITVCCDEWLSQIYNGDYVQFTFSLNYDLEVAIDDMRKRDYVVTYIYLNCKHLMSRKYKKFIKDCLCGNKELCTTYKHVEYEYDEIARY